MSGPIARFLADDHSRLPAAQQARGGEPLPIAAKLRLDHGALAALLVPTPTPTIIAALRAILAAHNMIEEGPGGVYELCEQLAGPEAEALLAQLHAAPEVPVAPHSDGPRVLAATRRALARAGYDFHVEEKTLSNEDHKTGVRGRILSLVYYLQSIQEK
jgi:hypothetical protein